MRVGLRGTGTLVTISCTVMSLLPWAPVSGEMTPHSINHLNKPSLVFLPRKAREAFIFYEPTPFSELSQTYWLEDWDERNLEREGASDELLQSNALFEKRVGGLVTLKTRPHYQVDSEFSDLRGRLLHNDRFGDGFSPDVRARFRWAFGDAMESGLVVYYRHREREVGRSREITDWATALNTTTNLGEDAVFIDENETRDSPETHTMDEIGGRLDFWLTPRTSFQLSGVFRESDEQLIERRQEFDTRSGTRGLTGQTPDRGNQYASGVVEDSVLVSGQSLNATPRIEYQLKDELEEKKRYAFDGALRHEFDDYSFVQFDGEYAYKEKAEPDRRDVEFARENSSFSYTLRDDDGELVPFFDGGPKEALSAGYGLRKLELEDNLERQWYQQYRLFAQMVAPPDWSFQGGFFASEQRHSEDIAYRRFEDPEWQNAGELFQADGFLDGSGRLNPNATAAIDPSLLEFNEAETEFKSFAEDFNSKRSILGGWIQAAWAPEPRFRLSGAFRYEATEADYRGFNAQWNSSEDFGNIIFPRTPVSVSEVSRKVDHGHLLPLVRLEYQPRSNIHVLVEARQSLQRGKLWELAATEAYDLDGGTAPEAILGNPDLEPSVQSQLFSAVNFALAPASILRIYAEYWDMLKPIARASWFQSFQLEDPAISNNFQANYRFEQTINAERGRLYRAGLNWTHLLSEFPHPFDQLGVFASTEVTRSEQTISVNGNHRSSDLVSMPDFRGTLGLYYDSPRWNVLLSGNYHDDYLFRVGENRNGVSGAGDQFVSDRLTMNLGVEYKFTKQLELSFEVRNLLDSSLRFYEGTEQRQTYREYTGRSFLIGAHLFF